MKAALRKQYGGPEVIQVKDISKPAIQDDEMLIKVHYSTVNRTDCGILTGMPKIIRLFTGLRKPTLKITGTDFSGEVVDVGVKVKEFKVGDRVWGLNDQGLQSHAEYLKIKPDNALVHMPESADYRVIVSCAEGAHYAYNFINKVSLKPSDQILVNGSTGAIGSAALQILKSKGLTVTAVGNSKNKELLFSLGADQVYCYDQEDFTQVDNQKYDFIFDAVGKSSFSKCKHLLKAKGIYISSELGPGNENIYLPLITKLKGGKRVVFPFPSNPKRSLEFMNDLISSGKFQAVIDREYRLEKIAEAYEYVMTGEKTGNVILNCKS